MIPPILTATELFGAPCWRSYIGFWSAGDGASNSPRSEPVPAERGAAGRAVDGERVIHDSWVIAEHLEDTYPQRPSLFGSAEGRGMAKAINSFVNLTVQPLLAPLIVRLMAMGVSRKREYLADAMAAQFTRNPQALADARP